MILRKLSTLIAFSEWKLGKPACLFVTVNTLLCDLLLRE